MKSNTRENAMARSVWVDSHIGLQYKYKSALIGVAESEVEFENALQSIPVALKESLVSDLTAEYAFLQESGIVPIPIWDENYPQKLLHLSHPPLVLYAKGNISFNEKGKKIAEETYEKHQVLSKFFMSLNVPEDIAYSDACKIEHDISKESFDAIKNMVDKMDK